MTLRSVLRVSFSGIFSKCLQEFLAIYLKKTELFDLKEQRVCAKFGFLLGKTAFENVTMLNEAVEDKCMSIYTNIVFLFLLRGCETWLLTFRKERRLRMF